MAVTGFIGSSAITTFTHGDSESVLARSINPLSTDAEIGDLFVVFASGDGGFNTPSILTPSGWETAISASNSFTDTAWGIHWKILDSGDNQTYNFVSSGASRYCLIYKFFTSPTSVVADLIAAEDNSGNPGSQTKTISAITVPLIVFGAFSADTSSSFTTSFSTTEDDSTTAVDGSFRCYFEHKVYNSSPANTTIDMGDEGSINFLASFIIKRD